MVGFVADGGYVGVVVVVAGDSVVFAASSDVAVLAGLVEAFVDVDCPEAVVFASVPVWGRDGEVLCGKATGPIGCPLEIGS